MAKKKTQNRPLTPEEATEIVRQWVNGEVVLRRYQGLFYFCLYYKPKGTRGRIGPVLEFLKKQLRGREIYVLIEAEDESPCTGYYRPGPKREFTPFRFNVPEKFCL